MTPVQILYGALLIVAVLGILFFDPKLRRFIAKHMIGLMSATLVCGFVIYMIGFWYGSSENLVTAAFRSIIAALEMFASQNELIEVSETLKEESTLYMVCFSLIHFTASVLALIFILDLFGKRLHSRIEAYFLKFNATGKTVYLIDGTDENCITLAKSLPEGKDRLIIFVKGVIDSSIKHLSFFDAFLSGIKGNRENDLCEEIGIVLHTSLPLAVAITQDSSWIRDSITEILHRSKTAEVFLISEDASANTSGSYELQKSVLPGQNIRIYAGVNPSNPQAEKLKSCQNVIMTSRSLLAVKNLLESTPLMKEGYGRKTLIVGFGHTGSTCLTALSKAGFGDIDVTDPEIKNRSEEFLCFHPGIRDCAGIRFINAAPKSNELWNYLYKNIESLGNVIIFSQDDAANFSLALKILRYRASLGSDTSDFRVYLMEQYRQPGDDIPGLYPFGRRESIFNYNLVH